MIRTTTAQDSTTTQEAAPEAIVAIESEGAAASFGSWWMLPAFLVLAFAFAKFLVFRGQGWNPLKWRVGSRA